MVERRCPGLPVVLAVALIAYPLIGTDTARGAEKATPTVKVKVGVLKGTLLDAMGKPVEKVTIEVLAHGETGGTSLGLESAPKAVSPESAREPLPGVLGKDGEAAATAVTGKDGTFATKALAAGDYTLKVGTHNPLTLKVAEEGDLSHLLIIIPAKAQYSAGAMTLMQQTWVVVGAVVVATAVTLPLVLNDEDGEEAAAPSPTPTRARARRHRISP